MQQYLQQKKGLVQSVFNRVFEKYDLMNDLMSLGIHRLWKKELIYMMNPSNNNKLIDVASGTGDIAKMFAECTSKKSEILCVDPNKKMLEIGRKKLKKFENINWKIAKAEKLFVQSNYFDFYVISFGLRNTKNLNKSISEAYRVLKKGGRFFCLEFSKIQNSNLEFIYKNYTKVIPELGRLIVGNKNPYEYLLKSIDNFINQDQLLKKLRQNNFKNCKYRNLSGGIVSIHSGWKL